MKKIAIMTAGGDCAGLNSVIKTVVMSAQNKGITVVGILDGFIGFVEKRYKVLDKKQVENIENIGGTILGSSNKENPAWYKSEEDENIYINRIDEGINALKQIGVEAMIIIGGDGTLDSARQINERGMNVIGIPKTIDNDMPASSPTIGFNTAVENVLESINKLKTTAFSHRRIFVVEMMGRTSGYLTLYGGLSSGADVILIPEIEYDINKVCNHIKGVIENGKRYAIIAVSEAAKEHGKEEVIARLVEDSFEKKRYGGVSEIIAKQIENITGYETRNMVLGHIQRGGNPVASDIILGARLGNYALELLIDKQSGYVVGVKEDTLIKTKFTDKRVARLLDVKTNDLIKSAKNMGIYFGD